MHKQLYLKFVSVLQHTIVLRIIQAVRFGSKKCLLLCAGQSKQIEEMKKQRCIANSNKSIKSPSGVRVECVRQRNEVAIILGIISPPPPLSLLSALSRIGL